MPRKTIRKSERRAAVVDPDLRHALGTCAACGNPSNTAYCAICLPSERDRWPDRAHELIAVAMMIKANPETRGIHRRLHPLKGEDR
jgi:recombinational DNA repair protein RecR